MKIRIKETHIRCYDKHNNIKDIWFDDFIHDKLICKLCIDLCDELQSRGLLKYKECVETDNVDKNLKHIGLEVIFNTKGV